MNPFCDCGHMSRNHKDEGYGACLIKDCDCPQFHNKDIQIDETPVETDPVVIKAQEELKLLTGINIPGLESWYLDMVRQFLTFKFEHAWQQKAMADLLARSFQGKTLGSITDSPLEWEKLESISPGSDLWRNKRDGSLFSTDGGHTHFNLYEALSGLVRTNNLVHSEHAADYDR